VIHICGRMVKVQTGTKSQSVNICSSANIHGQYDWIVRLRPPFISTETLLRQNFGSIEDLVRYLELHDFGKLRQDRANTGNSGFGFNSIPVEHGADRTGQPALSGGVVPVR
jgi:hypothetical protein